VNPPEAAQQLQRHHGQAHETVFVALARADVHASARRVDIGDRQIQPLAEAQPKAVKGEEENAVS
jgi:hypothetical protein